MKCPYGPRAQYTGENINSQKARIKKQTNKQTNKKKTSLSTEEKKNLPQTAENRLQIQNTPPHFFKSEVTVCGPLWKIIENELLKTLQTF